MSSPALSLPRTPRVRAVHLTGLGAIACACLALALLSLLFPTTPTYDPYAWLIWGRQVLHLELDTQFGPSWKPLPVLFTTIFSLVPSAAPYLWVAIARAGALAAIVLTFRVTRRLGGGWVGGLVAAACLAVCTDFLRFAAIGDSEGLLVALLLAAVDLHLSGRRRAALWLLFAACLLRPEAWPFAGVYALWLWRADPGVRRLVGLMVVAGAALWFLPELWGSGDPLRAGSRARDPNPNAATFAEHPAWEVVKRFGAMLPWPAEIGGAALLAALAARRVRNRTLTLLVLGALAWLALVALMTEAGFSGNARYLIAPIALACVAGGVAWGWAFARIPRVGALVGLAVAAALLFAPARDLPADARAARNEARLLDRLSDSIKAAGGRRAVLDCGSVTTGPFQVTALAWRLDVPVRRIDLVPTVPGTVFRAGPAPRSVPGAPVVVVGDPRWRKAAHVDPWQVLAACRPPSAG